MKTVLSLGAGVESSTLALMSEQGTLPRLDFAIFADPQQEFWHTYRQVADLRRMCKFPIYCVSAGDIAKDGELHVETGSRWAKMPLFTLEDGKKGRLLRQCTKEYKIEPFRKELRKHIKGLEKVEVWIGVAADESVWRVKDSPVKYITHRWPLLELKMTRQDCKGWLLNNNYKVPEKSACTMCPYHSNAFWLDMKNNHSEEFARVVRFDKKIRQLPTLQGQTFLHKSCQPLVMAIDQLQVGSEKDEFNNECSGVCGL